MSLADRVVVRAGERTGATARSQAMRETRILTLDIERFPFLAAGYDLRTTYIPFGNIVQPSRMCCVAAKWLDSDEVFFLAEYDFDKGKLTKPARRKMLTEIRRLVDEADIIVSFNGNRFDLPHLTTEWVLAGVPEPSPVKSVDLYQVGRKRLRLESNSLRYMCQRLGLPAKGDYGGMKAMLAAMDGDREVWEHLRDYNAQDVISTEALYLRLQGHNPQHPMMGSAFDGLRCNQCGGTNLEPAGWNRATVLERAQYRCTHCGGFIVTTHFRRVGTSRGVS